MKHRCTFTKNRKLGLLIYKVIDEKDKEYKGFIDTLHSDMVREAIERHKTMRETQKSLVRKLI